MGLAASAFIDLDHLGIKSGGHGGHVKGHRIVTVIAVRYDIFDATEKPPRPGAAAAMNSGIRRVSADFELAADEQRRMARHSGAKSQAACGTRICWIEAHEIVVIDELA